MKRSGPLDLVRGLAAVFVMIGHLRSLFLPPFHELANKGVIARSFYFVTGYGHQCVIVFFALSGYFVGAAYHKGFNSDTIGLHTKKYALNRLVRLWTVLIPALLFTALADWLGQHATGGNAVYTSSNYFEFIPLSNDRSISTFFGNLFFIQTIFVPTFGTDAPLWSLANEFWYYLLFPFLYLLFIKKLKALAKVGIGVFILLTLCVLGRNNSELIEGFLVWLLGFGVSTIKLLPESRFSKILRIASILFFVIVFALSRVIAIPHSMLVIGLAACILIFAIRDLQLNRLSRISDFLSRISYTLYLVHLPFLILVSTTIMNSVQLDGDYFGMLIVIAASVVTIAFSYLMYLLFERRTDEIRTLAGRILLRKS
ncbi:MAG TPA: acyltransferase [Cyclobacteriaceae bacterium]